MHPFRVTVVGDYGIVTDRTLIGQDCTIGGFARGYCCHVASDHVVDYLAGIGATHKDLF